MKTLFYSLVAFCSLGVSVLISWAFDDKNPPHRQTIELTDGANEYKYNAKKKEAEILKYRNEVIEIQERILFKIDHKKDK